MRYLLAATLGLVMCFPALAHNKVVVIPLGGDEAPALTCALVNGASGLDCITEGLTNLSGIRAGSSATCYIFLGASFTLSYVIQQRVHDNGQLTIFQGTQESELPANAPGFVFDLIVPGQFNVGDEMLYIVTYHDGAGNSQALGQSVSTGDCSTAPTQGASKVTFTGPSGQRWEITPTFVLSNFNVRITNIAFKLL